MKKTFLIPLSILFISLPTVAQKGISRFGIQGGYARFPEMGAPNGISAGIEYNYYVKDRIFVFGSFLTALNNGHWTTTVGRTGHFRDFRLHNEEQAYMMAFGLGGDLLQYKRHRIYMQGGLGIGSSHREKERYNAIRKGDTFEYVSITDISDITRFAIQTTAGYEYQINHWLGLGVNYTGMFVGQNFISSVNLKTIWTF